MNELPLSPVETDSDVAAVENSDKVHLDDNAPDQPSLQVYCQVEGNAFQSRLNDAAIVLCEALRASHIAHGFFGGFAVHSLGGERESKDVDCLAAGSKEDVIEAMKSQESFSLIPQSRQDFVAFLWIEKFPPRTLSGRQFPVLVKVFVDKFPGVRYNMNGIKTCEVEVEGMTRGKWSITVLDPLLIFKGKLEACANRSLISDSIDLRQLALLHGTMLRKYSAEFAPQTIRQALVRHSELRTVFIDLGVGVSRTQRTTKQFVQQRLTCPGQGEIQKALLDKSREGFVPIHSITLKPSAYRSPTCAVSIATFSVEGSA